MSRTRGIILAVALLATLLNLVNLLPAYFSARTARTAFYDFRLWRSAVERYAETGTLYDLETPGYFDPGSHSLYKYPPLFATLLMPFAGVPQRVVGPVFFSFYLVVLGAAFALLIAALRPGPWKAAWMGLALINWQPIWETMSDLQMEMLILALVAACGLALGRGRRALAGLPLGVAGALKVYPWALLVFLAARARWRALAGAAAGAILALALTLLAFPAELSRQFFFDILPKLGGTSLSYENLSLLGFFGRILAEVASGTSGAAAFDTLVLERLQPGWVVPAAYAAWIIAGGAAVYLFARRMRRWQREGVPGTDIVGLAGAVCLLLLFIPSSWISYQALLALPVLVLLARSDERALWRRPAAYLALAPGLLLNGYGRIFAAMPAVVSLVRAAVPVLLLYLLAAAPRTQAGGTQAGPVPARQRG